MSGFRIGLCISAAILGLPHMKVFWVSENGFELKFCNFWFWNKAKLALRRWIFPIGNGEFFIETINSSTNCNLWGFLFVKFHFRQLESLAGRGSEGEKLLWLIWGISVWKHSNIWRRRRDSLASRQENFSKFEVFMMTSLIKIPTLIESRSLAACRRWRRKSGKKRKFYESLSIYSLEKVESWSNQNFPFPPPIFIQFGKLEGGWVSGIL